MRSLTQNLCVVLFLLPFTGSAQPVLSPQIVVHAGAAGVPIQPTMWGIFFEDINMAADGGLYAELVKNRSFEFNIPLMGWKEHKTMPADGSVLVINRQAEIIAYANDYHMMSFIVIPPLLLLLLMRKAPRHPPK